MPKLKKSKKSWKSKTSQSSFNLSPFYLKTAFVGLYMAVCGFILNSPSNTAFANLPVKNSVIVRLEIPILHLTLPIVEGQKIENNWQISKDAVNHLSTSANPRENNNIVIYGHNTQNLLVNLTKLEINQEIDLKTNDGKVYTYAVQTKKVVAPQETSFIKPSNSEILTIYTCTGLFDSQRLIIQALPLTHE